MSSTTRQINGIILIIIIRNRYFIAVNHLQSLQLDIYIYGVCLFFGIVRQFFLCFFVSHLQPMDLNVLSCLWALKILQSVLGSRRPIVYRDALNSSAL